MKVIILASALILNPMILIANNLALPCYGCHKVVDTFSSSSIPSIEGLEKAYFVKAFNEYKNKIRDNYLMHIISKGYTTEQVKLLADYFSKKKNNYD
jgi:cytochrome c553